MLEKSEVHLAFKEYKEGIICPAASRAQARGIMITRAQANGPKECISYLLSANLRNANHPARECQQGQWPPLWAVPSIAEHLQQMCGSNFVLQFSFCQINRTSPTEQVRKRNAPAPVHLQYATGHASASKRTPCRTFFWITIGLLWVNLVVSTRTASLMPCTTQHCTHYPNLSLIMLYNVHVKKESIRCTTTHYYY